MVILSCIALSVIIDGLLTVEALVPYKGITLITLIITVISLMITLTITLLGRYV